MRYRQAYEYINSFTNYEKEPGLGEDVGADQLERVRLLLRLLGRPQLRFKSVVVAGTKGKGSVAALIESALRAAGHKTGLFTSPHLHTFRERIRVDGEMIPPDEVGRMVEEIQPVVERIRGLEDPTLLPTYFEMATAIAFTHFRDAGVEIAVLEVGLGGRLDPVNVTEPLVSVITPISLDHTHILGNTVAEIAREKAGIIKRHGRVICGPQSDEALAVIARVAAEQRARLTLVGREVYVGTGHLPEVVLDEHGAPAYQAFTVAFESAAKELGDHVRLKLPLLGEHQQVNAAVAVAALAALHEAGTAISRQAIQEGFASVQWPGRFEIVRRDPLVVVDGAHNVEAIRKLNQAVGDLFYGRRAVVVLGLSSDKDIEGIVREIAGWSRGGTPPRVAELIVTRSRHPRAAGTEQVARIATERGLNVEAIDSVPEALARAELLAREGAYASTAGGDAGPIVVVTGSLFVVAEAREHYGLAPDLAEEED